MENFAKLYFELETATTESEAILSFSMYLANAPEKDKLQAISLLSGNRPMRILSTSNLKEYLISFTGIPAWLFVESFNFTRDVNETMALLLPLNKVKDEFSLSDVLQIIESSRESSMKDSCNIIQKTWQQLDYPGRILFNKLVTGTFRLMLDDLIMVKSIANVTGKDEETIALCLKSDWQPAGTSFKELFTFSPNKKLHKPYPFLPINKIHDPHKLPGIPVDWIGFQKHSGINVQIIIRDNKIFIWTREGKLVNEKFPEFEILSHLLPDGTILEGEILPADENRYSENDFLEKRLKRKFANRKLLEDFPVRLIVEDIIHLGNTDFSQVSWEEKVPVLKDIIHKSGSILLNMPRILRFTSMEDIGQERKNTRENQANGLMLIKLNEPGYRESKSEACYFMPPEPFKILTLLLYGEREGNISSRSFSSFTLGIYKENELVPVAKVENLLEEKKKEKVEKYILNNTIEKFGPTRMVEPGLIIELSFEGIRQSNRRKAGIILLNPGILKLWEGANLAVVNRLEDLTRIMSMKK